MQTIRRSNWMVGALVSCLAFSSMAQAEWKPESQDPIKLTINEWTGQTITTHIAGDILKGMGYNVEYVVAGYFPQMTALQDGSVSAALEIWTTNIGDAYDKAIATKNVVDVGALGLKPVETWFYPAYVDEKCPGLPDWQALKNCADVFATADTLPDGRLVDYPADWGTTNVDRLKALGLPFVSVPAGSEGALVAEIQAAFAKKEPLLVMFFSPHWIFGELDMKTVQLPPYEAGCFDRPEVGINKDAAYDCDFVRGDVRKVAWSGLEAKWPAASKVLKALEVTNEQQIPLINLLDKQGKSLDEVSKVWRDENEALWKGWVTEATK